MSQNKNAFIYFLGKLVPALAQLLIIVFGVRILGTEAYGKYNLLYGSAMIISSLFIAWIQQGILKFFFSLEEENKHKRGLFLKITLVPVLFSIVATIIIGQTYFQLDGVSQFYFSLFTALFCCLSVVLTLMQTGFKPFLYALSESAFYLLSIGFAAYYIVYEEEKNFIVFFKAMGIALLLLLMLMGAIVLKRNKVGFSSTTNVFFKKVFHYGFPLTIWLFVSNAFNIADRFVIEHYKGYEAVGEYSSVYDLIYKVSGFITLPLLLAFHPEISKKWSEKNEDEVKRLTNTTLIKEIGISILIFICFFLIKRLIFETVFKIQIENINTLFITLAASSILWQASLIIQKPLELNYRQKLMIVGISITIVLNFFLNLLLVPHYGIIAAGFTTLASTLFYFIFVYINSNKELATLRHG